MFKQTDAMKDDTKELTLFDTYDFIEKIESLMADCESAEVEFKSARGGFPGSLWETYSAFANTQGGVIVLGVKEKDGKFTLDGITLEQARKYKKEFWDNVNNKAHCSANVLQEKDVQDGEYNGSYVLVFNVPRVITKFSDGVIFVENVPSAQVTVIVISLFLYIGFEKTITNAVI